jgi:predicted GNAT family N-acyltransferase
MAAITWHLSPFDALSPRELYDILALRQRVFIVEQKCAYLDCDGKDALAMHLMGRVEGALAAYARILPPSASFKEAAIGRIVTAPEYRRAGYGRPLMREAIARTREAYGRAIRIGAQRYLERFYGELGFVVASDEYDEDGIPHVEMVLAGEQSVMWNGTFGKAWIESQEVIEPMLQPFENLLVDAVPRKATRILDVGCGTGGMTFAIARRVGACTGVDVSEPMIAIARARAERENAKASFLAADAQTHAFEPAYDAIVSRFGVMFFEDPVAAFANLRRAAVEGASLRFIAWRAAAENPFMTTAERAAAPILPSLPPRLPDAPGQFAFADRDRVQRILADSGWSGIDVAPIDVACSVPAQLFARYVTKMGPVGRALQDADDATRARVAEMMRGAFQPYVRGEEIRFTGACWMVSASRS